MLGLYPAPFQERTIPCPEVWGLDLASVHLALEFGMGASEPWFLRTPELWHGPQHCATGDDRILPESLLSGDVHYRLVETNTIRSNNTFIPSVLLIGPDPLQRTVGKGEGAGPEKGPYVYNLITTTLYHLHLP